MDITLTVNGEKRSVTTDPQRSLLDALREDLHLTGTKYGCGRGQCGACTVLVDGQSVHACTHKAADANGKEVTTIEGLARGERLHPVQEAFLAEGATQCGFCASGMIMRAVALLDRDPHPSDPAIVSWMNGNICRCNDYTKILKAIRRAARRRSAEVTP